MSTLNENIKKFRELRKMNQKQLADFLQKSRAVISNWERGANSPDPDTIEQICKVLNVTPNMLWEQDAAGSNPVIPIYRKCPENRRIKRQTGLFLCSQK